MSDLQDFYEARKKRLIKKLDEDFELVKKLLEGKCTIQASLPVDVKDAKDYENHYLYANDDLFIVKKGYNKSYASRRSVLIDLKYENLDMHDSWADYDYEIEEIEMFDEIKNGLIVKNYNHNVIFYDTRIGDIYQTVTQMKHKKKQNRSPVLRRRHKDKMIRLESEKFICLGQNEMEEAYKLIEEAEGCPVLPPK